MISTTPAFSSEGVRTLPGSAQSMGQVGGRIANVFDPSSVRENPSAMVNSQSPRVQGNGAYWFGQVDYRGPGGSQADMDDTHAFLPSLYWTTPVSESAAVGIGLTVPYGLTIDWPENGPFRYVLPHENLLETFALNAAVGYQLTDNLSIGLGGELLYSNLELEQAVPWGLIGGNPLLGDGLASYEGDGLGGGAYTAMTLKLTDRQRLSVVARTPVSVDHGGSYSVSHVPRGRGFSSTSDFSSDIQYPGSIAFGYGVDVTSSLTIGIDVEWIQNSSHESLELDIGENQALLGGDGILLDWNDSVSAGAGAEWRVGDKWTLRAGYLFSESPMPSETFLPSVPAYDRHIVSLGFGYRSGNHAIDVAYSVALFPERTVSGNMHSPAFNGTYDFSWQVATLSYTLNF